VAKSSPYGIQATPGVNVACEVPTITLTRRDIVTPFGIDGRNDLLMFLIMLMS
jgi:hypothetical protein